MAAWHPSGRDRTRSSGRLLGRVHVSIQPPHIQISRQIVLSPRPTVHADRSNPVCNPGQTTTHCVRWRQVNIPIGEYETDVERAQIALEPTWFPAVENRGEGLFVQLSAQAVNTWQTRPAVSQRLIALARGHKRWGENRKSKRPF